MNNPWPRMLRWAAERRAREHGPEPTGTFEPLLKQGLRMTEKPPGQCRDECVKYGLPLCKTCAGDLAWRRAGSFRRVFAAADVQAYLDGTRTIGEIRALPQKGPVDTSVLRRNGYPD